MQTTITQHHEITTNFIGIVFAVFFGVAFITGNSKLYFYMYLSPICIVVMNVMGSIRRSLLTLVEYSYPNYKCIFLDNTRTWLILLSSYLQAHIKHFRLQWSTPTYQVEISESGHIFWGLLKTAGSIYGLCCRKKCG